jgi:hypothetical protein
VVDKEKEKKKWSHYRRHCKMPRNPAQTCCLLSF